MPGEEETHSILYPSTKMLFRVLLACLTDVSRKDAELATW